MTSETLHQILEQSIPGKPSSRSKKRDELSPITFLASLQELTRERTGLILPITPTVTKKPLATNANGAAPADEPPLRVTRIQCTAFAIGMEGRLKFSSRPVEMMEVVPGLTSGNENVVKLANRDLLEAVVKEAERVQRPD